jgi:chaperonin GroES
MSIELLHDNVLVAETPRAEKTAGGLYMPSTDKDSKIIDGTVVAVGPGIYVGEKFIETTVKPKTKVWFQQFQAFQITLDNKEYFVVPERFILGYDKK